jgi:enamine deaminase RidA (YjgF/YER057c/UK114 family)
MARQNISSGSPYEKPIGFSRAVRVGNQIAVSGTGPIGRDGRTAAVGDAYGQAVRCVEIIKEAIEKAGASLEDVVRTRIYITDLSIWHEVAKAHGEFFGEIHPASTMVVVRSLVQPDWYVEMEADCVVED